MENFPSNSDKQKSDKKDAPEKHVEKVVTGEVIQKKKPFSERFKGVFLGGELRQVSGYIVAEVLLPALRNLLVDATSKGVERMVYGESQVRRTSSGSRAQYTSYNNTPLSRGRGRGGYLPDQPRGGSYGSRNTVLDPILENHEQAELVLERMLDIIEQFDAVSVADLNTLLGMPTTYIDNKWGWTDLRYATVRQIREGYLIDLPPTESLS